MLFSSVILFVYVLLFLLVVVLFYVFLFCYFIFFFFFKQKTAYEMRISDWSSDVCSSDLIGTTECLPLAVSPRYLLYNNTLSHSVSIDKRHQVMGETQQWSMPFPVCCHKK